MDELYDMYYFKIYNYMVKRCNNKEDAEDLTNNVFVAILKYYNKNINIEKLDNLIWKITTNIWSIKAKKYIKEKDNISYDDTYDVGSEENFIDKIIYKEIVDNLDKFNLTIKEKESFNLFYLKNLSINEISMILKTSNSNIKFYLYNARKKIKEAYNG